MSDIAVIYVRHSTGKQAFIDMQIENCRKYAEEHNLQISHIYSDVDPSFVQLDKLLVDSNSHQFGNIIIHSVDRLNRYIESITYILRHFENNNIKVHSCTDRENPTSYNLGIKGVMLDFEREMMNNRKREQNIHS